MYRNPRTWPDAEDALIAALAALWPGAIHYEVPSSRPAEFVVIERDGGGNDGTLDRAAVTIEVWSGTPGDSKRGATSLAALIRDLLKQTPRDANPITDYTEESFAYLPDEISGSPRVIITATVTLQPSGRIEEISA